MRRSGQTPRSRRNAQPCRGDECFGPSCHLATDRLRPSREELREVPHRLPGDRRAEVLGQQAAQRSCELIGADGDEQAIDVVRVLVEEAGWFVAAFAELVELCDQQRGRTCDIRGDDPPWV